MGIATLLAIFGLAVFLHDYTKLRKQFTFFVSVSVVVFFLYVASLIGQLKLCCMILFCLGTALFAYYFYSEFFSKKSNIFFKTPEFVSYLTISTLLYVLLLPSYFKEWDEFSHWGLFDKYLTVFDGLPKTQGVVLFPHYPPGQNLFHYFFEFHFGFAENISYYANAIILSSALFGFTSFVKGDNYFEVIAKTLFVFLVFALGIELIYKNSWHWLYADHTLAVVFGAIVLMVYELKDDQRLFLYLFFPVFFLTILKPYAFIFGGTIFLILLFYYIMQRYNKGYLNSAIAIFVAVGTAYLSWILHLKYGTSVQNQSFGLVIDGLKQSFAGTRGERDLTTIWAFAVFLAKKASIILVALGVLIFVVLRIYKEDNVLKSIIYAFFIGLFVFLIFLLLSYLYLFSDIEGPKLASIERYTPSYIFSLAALLLFLLLKKVPMVTVSMRLIYAGIVSICLFLAYKAYSELMKENLVEFRRSAAEMDVDIKAISGMIKKDSKICVISGDFWFDRLYLNYKLLPNVKNYINIADVTLNANDVEHIMANYDYVILRNLPQDFFDIFAVGSKSSKFILLGLDNNKKAHIKYEN